MPSSRHSRTSMATEQATFLLFFNMQFVLTTSRRLFVIVALTGFLQSCISGGKFGTASSANTGIPASDSVITVFVLGDWGDQGSAPQRKVAQAMAQTATRVPPRFILTTGDNFYPAGVRDTADLLWKTNFEEVYNAPSLQVPWLPVLGNHDYLLNPDAQVDYTAKKGNWHMPARYYDSSFAIGNDSVLFVFMDTEPIEQFLRKMPPDPARFPEGGAHRQLIWLQAVLQSSRAKWKVVLGHHPLHTGGTRRHSSRTRKMRDILQPIFKQAGVDLYLSGHEHQLEYLKPGNQPTHYVISGAGSETRHVGYLKRYRRFAARQKGFAVISIASTKITLQFIGDDQRILFSSEIGK